MTAIITGPYSWGGSQDDEKGNREYKLVFRATAATTDGPANVMRAVGMPTIGSLWNFGTDVDIIAYRTPYCSVTPQLEGEPNSEWLVELKYTTKGRKYCNEGQIDNPLLEPIKVNGTYNKFQEEASTDRFGLYIRNSSLEQLRGPQVEFDKNRLTIKIEQNVANLQLSLINSMIDTVNDRILWGLPARCVKLSAMNFETKYYGQCFRYYTRTLEFETNTSTFDKLLVDEGTMVLNGHWDNETGAWVLDDIAGAPPNRFKQGHFIRATDKQGNQIRAILDGMGKPYQPEPSLLTCDECADEGTFPIWAVNIRGVTYNLSYTGDCTWKYNNPSIPGDHVTLEFLGVDWGVSQVLNGVLRTWSSTGEWNCTGPNLLTNNGPNGPTNILAYNASVPGTIGIQKYQESNFFLISGLPPII